MKQFLMVTVLLVCIINTAISQRFEKPAPPARQAVIIKTVPATPPPPPVTTKTEATNNPATLVYSLTSVKATIRTGNDNKEYPSEVRTSVGVRGSGMEFAYFRQDNLKNEMRSNSTTEFGLEKLGTNLKDISLPVLQNKGLEFRIDYIANFQFDAWKIEGVTVTLEFRDQNGNLHPTLGQKTISFSNANGFLNGYDGTRGMICYTDGYFNPLSAYIR